MPSDVAEKKKEKSKEKPKRELVELSTIQNEILTKALKAYEQAEKEMQITSQHLNDIGVLLAGRGFSVVIKPDGAPGLLPAEEEEDAE